MATNYEWDLETYEGDDIIDHWFAEKLSNLPLPAATQVLVLVRRVGYPDEGVGDREWAYIQDGKLPEIFDGGTRVPQRFHREYEQWLA